MEKIFFITAMLFNAETLELEPKFNQSVWFYERINCESYVQQNYKILHDGLQLYLDMEGDKREIQSMGCTATTLDELRKLLQEENTNTIAA
tara:strand:- start:280 stop:552 length:273 start_codon:yes stop_codon:yes gene_type:complete